MKNRFLIQKTARFALVAFALGYGLFGTLPALAGAAQLTKGTSKTASEYSGNHNRSECFL